jgi:GNAT superfamily N-acetyltransferase
LRFFVICRQFENSLTAGQSYQKIKELVPREMSLQSYPAFLIGRLGVSVEFAGQGIGSQLMRNIKYYCDSRFSTLVRFLVVDAYNNDTVLSYYLKNRFLFVFSTEQQEKENMKKAIQDNEPLRTRQMFYDMKRFESE